MSARRNANQSEGLVMQIPVGSIYLRGRLLLADHPRGLVIVANGDGDHLYDQTNAYVARQLAEAGFATLAIDLLTPTEAIEDAETSALRFHQSLLASRLVRVTHWVRSRPVFSGLEVGYFASGLCAGAAIAAASVASTVGAVVCRGARVDLVVPQIQNVRAPVLLLVGERDTAHIAASRGAYWLLPESARLEVIPNGGHLLDDLLALGRVVDEAKRWFGDAFEGSPAALDDVIDGMLAGVP
ncbi:MAG TPA: dienelactone hydrolase family protein [Gemmatimonadaceae bacterium]|nr:dienelactone hydrolase family protein [Gemmatimonadaceae bacterium]